jgi:hypothetical protein
MKTIYVHFASPSGRKIMYVSTAKTVFPVSGPTLFETTTTKELVELADEHEPDAVDFADSRFPRKATPIYKAISDHMFSKYVMLNNKDGQQ